MLNPSIEIINQWVWRKKMTADLRPTGVSEPRSPKLFVVVSGRSVMVTMLSSVGLDTGFTRSTRHEEEGDSNEDESKEVSGKGDFKRRHWRTPTKVPLVLSNHITPL